MRSKCAYPCFTFGPACIALAVLQAGPVFATTVIMQTPLGSVEIELFDEAKPVTVANFLKYVNEGDYEGSFIHRSVTNFVIQGGGYTFINNVVAEVPDKPPVVNEPGISNTRGTIAMAKLPGNPNSATSQWFINLKNNTGLDTDNGGYTVFGRVTGNGMTVIDAIAALKIWDAGAPFGELPLIDFPGSGTIQPEHLVYTDFSVKSDFELNAGLNDAWFNAATQGQGFFVNVFPDAGQVFLAWFTYEVERPAGSVTAHLGEPGHRWLTAFGPISGNTAELDIETTSGGVFNNAQPVPGNGITGSITLEFSDCENGTVQYDMPSIQRQGTIAIRRIANDNVDRCEELAAGD